MITDDRYLLKALLCIAIPDDTDDTDDFCSIHRCVCVAVSRGWIAPPIASASLLFFLLNSS